MTRGTNFFTRFPELLKFWSPNNLEYSPQDILFSERYLNILWTCDFRHEFEDTPRRVRERHKKNKNGAHCLECVGFQSPPIFGVNDLLTQAPHIASMMVPGQINPAFVYKSSRMYLDFICADGHIWSNAVNRLFNGDGCNKCAGHEVVLGVNDLQSTFPDIASELINIDPNVLAKYSGKMCSWCCRACANIWYSTVANRTFNRSGCPSCRKPNSSKSEEYLIESVSHLFDSTISNEKLDTSWDNGRRLHCDYVGILTNKTVVVEYDGEYWHRDREDIDNRKTNILLDKGHLVVRYRESPLADLEIQHPNLLQISGPHLKDKINLPELEDWLYAKCEVA